jgi:hypothetical protein
MTTDVQFVYLRRGGHNYRMSKRMIDMTYAGRPGDVIWWYQDQEYIAFEYVDMLHIPQPQWIERCPGERDFEQAQARQEATIQWVDGLIKE